MSTIEVSELTKQYGEVLANDGLSFSVEPGEIFGYLGPNGAGKTTTIRTLMGLQSPTAGSAAVLGHEVREEAALIEAKRSIGYLPANPAFDETATGSRILDLQAAIKGASRRDELIGHFEPPLERRVRQYSHGNVQKLGLVAAFMHDPDLVIMDEPTAGLDPLMQAEFNEFVRAERDRGTTVFMSSHVLSEVRRVCDRVGIIRDGELLTVERVEDLLDRGGKTVRMRVAESVAAPDVDLDGVHELEVRGVEGATAGETELLFTYTGPINDLVSGLASYDLLELDVTEAPLEDVFIGFYDEDGLDDEGGDGLDEGDGPEDESGDGLDEGEGFDDGDGPDDDGGYGLEDHAGTGTDEPGQASEVGGEGV